MKQRDTRRRVRRENRRIAEHVHDPYKTRLKLPEPTRCPDCGALYREGRWEWPSYPPPAGIHEERCQACHRIHDEYPAGWFTLSGPFVKAHRAEIVQMLRHQEKLENAEHPLHRIIGIADENDGLVVTTTDIHLPRRLGEAMHHAYHGEVDFHYEEEAYRLRVTWSRTAAE